MRARMIISTCLLGFGLCAFGLADSSVQAQESENLQSDAEKTSYALGVDIGQQLQQMDLDLDVQVLIRGLQDALQGSDPLLSQEEKSKTLMALQQEIARAEQEKSREQAAANLEKGLEFRQEYQNQPGVQSTESGILYKKITQAEGETPDPQDVVTVHYHGTLVDGTVFDSSHKRGQPATFPLDQVIPGWTEILQLMPQGSKWEVVIPPEQAYGERTAGPVIGPNSTLIFEVELLEISSPE